MDTGEAGTHKGPPYMEKTAGDDGDVSTGCPGPACVQMFWPDGDTPYLVSSFRPDVSTFLARCVTFSAEGVNSGGGGVQLWEARPSRSLPYGRLRAGSPTDCGPAHHER